MNKMVAVVLIRKCLHIKHMFSSFNFDTNLYLYLITLQLHIPRALHNHQNLHIHSIYLFIFFLSPNISNWNTYSYHSNNDTQLSG